MSNKLWSEMRSAVWEAMRRTGNVTCIRLTTGCVKTSCWYSQQAPLHLSRIKENV